MLRNVCRIVAQNGHRHKLNLSLENQEDIAEDIDQVEAPINVADNDDSSDEDSDEAAFAGISASTSSSSSSSSSSASASASLSSVPRQSGRVPKKRKGTDV